MRPVSCALIAAMLIIPPVAACAQDADAENWRPLDPQNTLVLEVTNRNASEDTTRVVVIEMAPDLAPGHVARYKALVRQGFYDGRTFHRVLDDFMAQAGGLPGSSEGGPSPFPDLQAEFSARIGPEARMIRVEEMRPIGRPGPGARTSEAGFWNGFPVGYQPAAQAMVSLDGRRDVWMLHCPGTAAAARTSDPNSANFQFYLTRGEPVWLDASYTAWGRVRQGQEAVNALKLGEPVIGPDRITRMRIAADMPESERPALEVMRTDGPAFAALVDEAREAAAVLGQPLTVCEVEVPVRPAP